MDDPLYVELMEAYHVALDRGKHGGRISLSLEAQACLAPGVRALVLGTEEDTDAAAWEEDEDEEVEGMGAEEEETVVEEEDVADDEEEAA